MVKSGTGGEFQFALSVFRKGLEGGGCLVCHALAEAEERSLHSFLYEGMTTAPALVRFLGGGGFCARHFRSVTRLGVNRWSVGCVELAILCRHILPRATREAAEVRARRRRIRILGARRSGKSPAGLFPGKECIFCLEGREREDRFVCLLELVFDQEDFQRAVSSAGVCLPHGAMALASWKSTPRAERLWEILRARSDHLAGEISSFLEKYDDRHRKESFGAEGDVVERAVEFLSGAERGRLRRAPSRQTGSAYGGTVARKP